MPESLEVHGLAFSGRLLQRGFWIYVWRITTPQEECLYVGRTGDSSSPNAASPFGRMGQHLDFRENAKGNAMMRHLRARGLDPTRCNFQVAAVGPIFPEQQTRNDHDPYRDRVAALECALAKRLKKWGHDVLGSHASLKKLDHDLFEKVFGILDRELQLKPAIKQ